MHDFVLSGLDPVFGITDYQMSRSGDVDEPARIHAVEHAGVKHREHEVHDQDDEQDLLPARHLLCGIAHDVGLGAFVRIDDHDTNSFRGAAAS